VVLRRLRYSEVAETRVTSAASEFIIAVIVGSALACGSALAAPRDKPGVASQLLQDPPPPQLRRAGQYVSEGIRLAGEEKLAAAAEQFVKALQIDPRNTEALYNLGLIRMKWGDLNAAGDSFREVLRINPNHAAAQLRLASILTQFARDDQNYIPKAQAAYARAIELDPNQPEAHFNLGYLAIRQRDYHAAVNEYQKAVALDPRYPRVHLELGIALYQVRDFDAAYSMLQAAVAEEPGSAEAHHYCGLALGRRGEWEQSVQELRAAARLAPDEQEIHYALAEALRKGGHADEAAAEMATVQNLQVHSSEKTEAQFREYQARKSLEAGKMESAAEDFRQSLNLARDARTATNLGVTLLWKGDADNAIHAFQRALEIDQKYEWADYYLGVSYARKHEFARAEDALNKALELRHEFSEAEFYRGLVYAAQGRLQPAEADLRAAVHSRPDAAVTHYYLGSILLRQGKQEEGNSELAISRRLDPGFNPGAATSSPGFGAQPQPASKVPPH
jgi:tetratricopeptide (TPR) repeat protein